MTKKEEALVLEYISIARIRIANRVQGNIRTMLEDQLAGALDDLKELEKGKKNAGK